MSQAGFGSPTWAREPEDQAPRRADKPATPPSDSNLGNWAGFVQAVLNRYGLPRYGTAAVEVWNEPNLPDFWGGGSRKTFNPQPQRFARLYNAAYPVVQGYDLDPGAEGVQAPLSIPGGLSPLGNHKLDGDAEVYMLDATDQSTSNPANHLSATSVDALSVHLYANLATSDKDARQKLAKRWDQFRSGLRQSPTDPAAQFKTKDYWITEIGFPSRRGFKGAGRSSQSHQSTRLVQAYTTYGLKPIVKAFIVHRLFDQTIADPDDLRKAENLKPGVINHDLSTEDESTATPLDPRPAYCDLAVQRGASPC